MFNMPGRTHRGPLPPLTSDEQTLRDALHKHVDMLAGVIGERNVFRYDHLQGAAGYIEKTLAALGYTVTPQEFDADGKTVRNLDANLPGHTHPDQILIIGAHYDTVPHCPGANDNATGVAALLEMARHLRNTKLARTVRFVAFVNEEPPFFHTDLMGSLVYARRCRQRRENIVGMLTPETIGCYRDEPGSQTYPTDLIADATHPLLGGLLTSVARLALPNTGDFISFVGNTFSNDLLRAAIGSFRRHTPFPSEGYAAPGESLGLSDHWSFWQAGYPAVMITDTAPFRYPHYHRPTDTPDQIDYPRTARVTAGLTRVTQDLADAADW